MMSPCWVFYILKYARATDFLLWGKPLIFHQPPNICICFTFVYLFLNLIYSFIFGCAGFSLLRRIFSSCMSGRLLSICGAGASRCRTRALGCLQASVVAVHGLFSAREHRLSSCGAPALPVPQHVGSSWIRDQTHVSCLGWRSL